MEVGRWRAGRASAPVGGNPSVTRRRGQGSPGRSLSCRCCPRLSQNRIDFFPQALQGRSACATPGSVTRDVQQPWLSCARKHRLPAVLARFGALRGGEMDGAGPRRARAGRPSGAGAVVAHKLTSASCRLRSCFVTLGPRGNGRAVSGVRPAIAWARGQNSQSLHICARLGCPCCPPPLFTVPSPPRSPLDPPLAQHRPAPAPGSNDGSPAPLWFSDRSPPTMMARRPRRGRAGVGPLLVHVVQNPLTQTRGPP